MNWVIYKSARNLCNKLARNLQPQNIVDKLSNSSSSLDIYNFLKAIRNGKFVI